MASELEPCPYCGSLNISVGYDSGLAEVMRPAYFAVCRDCNVRGPACPTDDGAISAWSELVAVSKTETTTPLLPKDGENVNKPTADYTGVNSAKMRDEAMNEVRVRCTKDGISVEGARDIGSTSDTRAGSLSQFLRIAECWWNTYCEKSHRQETGCRGNAAKMREAMVSIKAGILKRRSENAWYITDSDILEKINAALAAPARNCDLYKTKEKAQEAFMGEACDHPCGNCWVEDINNECGVDWLFATAKEGVTNADK